jgi:transaldolase
MTLGLARSSSHWLAADQEERKESVMDRLKALQEAGVSIWLDTLSRRLITSGDLERYATELGVSGATSNPTVFAEAITTSDLYDGQMRRLVDAGVRDPRELFLSIALEDVREAADLFTGTFQRSGGRDGFVSFECTPDIAGDTDATIAQARELWHRLDRPNVMIKVPATEAGVPAIEALTTEGINVNVTLLFGLARYSEVMDAFIRGLERRRSAGLPLETITSVASFFVSRVDTKVDAILRPGSRLRGRVAIANARVAYQRFRSRFSSAHWDRLAHDGARAQRPLFASTGTKNSAYSDVRYVAELIGPHVINTVPLTTLQAFADHGVVERTVDTHVVEDEGVLRDADSAEIDMAAISAELEADGVGLFCDAYHRLLDCITAKTASVTGVPEHV